jgi:choline dehydrogenase-like flavoprotein
MSYDVIIIGSGAGGATAARRLAEAGKRVLILERGERVPREPQNWDAKEVFGNGRYVSEDSWLDGRGKAFAPQVHYNVGGATKHFGSALWRMEREDFGEVRHYGGTSPAWPVSYDEMRMPYYRAEKWYHVRYPEHEPVIAKLSDDMERLGLEPEDAPAALMENCVKCSTCDGFPCKIMAKGDAETCGITPALATGNVTLMTGAKVTHISQGRVAVEREESPAVYTAPVIILAAGAVNSAALWLRSGLPNSSDQVGRNYMCHQSQAVLAIGPHKIPRGFHKTLRSMRFYHDGPDGLPLGSIQMAGQPLPAMLRGESRLAALAPELTLREVSERSLTFWLMSEDLPLDDNRVTLRDGKIQLSYNPQSRTASRYLYRELARRLFSLGYPVHLRKEMPLSAVAHQCGTLRMGSDPLSSVVRPSGESWEVPGLYVADASVFPSSSAVNPALTVMANAIRVSDHILER